MSEESRYFDASDKAYAFVKSMLMSKVWSCFYYKNYLLHRHVNVTKVCLIPFILNKRTFDIHMFMSKVCYY